MANDGYREATVGNLSLYDCDGERRHTIYSGEAPEYGKTNFKKRYEDEATKMKLRALKHFIPMRFISVSPTALKITGHFQSRILNVNRLIFIMSLNTRPKLPMLFIRKNREQLNVKDGYRSVAHCLSIRKIQLKPFQMS